MTNEQAPATPLTVAEADAAWAKAKYDLTEAEYNAADANMTLKGARERERAAYRAFNAAVDAMRPKRGPRKAKQEGGAA